MVGAYNFITFEISIMNNCIEYLEKIISKIL